MGDRKAGRLLLLAEEGMRRQKDTDAWGGGLLERAGADTPDPRPGRPRPSQMGRLAPRRGPMLFAQRKHVSLYPGVFRKEVRQSRVQIPSSLLPTVGP